MNRGGWESSHLCSLPPIVSSSVYSISVLGASIYLPHKHAEIGSSSKERREKTNSKIEIVAGGVCFFAYVLRVMAVSDELGFKLNSTGGRSIA
jgi:hypothetical protein